MPIWKVLKIDVSEEIKSFYVDSLGQIVLLTPCGIHTYDGYILETIIKSSVNESFTTIRDAGQGCHLVGNSLGQTILINHKIQSSRICASGDTTFPVHPLAYDIQNEYLLTICGRRKIQLHFLNDGSKNEVGQFLPDLNVYDGIISGDQIWLASDIGLIRIPKDHLSTPEVIDPSHGTSDFLITNVYHAPPYIYFSDFHQTVQRMASDGHIESFPFSSQSKINDILVLQNCIFAAREDGLFMHNGHDWTKIFPSAGNETVVNVSSDLEGNIYVLTGSGLIHQGSILFQSFDLENLKTQALEQTGDTIWIGNNEGLFTYAKGELTQIHEFNITSISKSKQGLWIGTYSNGVFIIDRDGNVQTSMKSWHDVKGQSILSILPDDHGAYITSLSGITYLATERQADGSLNLLPKNILADAHNQDYIYQAIHCNGHIAMATEANGIRIQSQNNILQIDTFADGTDIGPVYSFQCDTLNRIWFSSLNGGLSYYDQTGAHKVSIPYHRREPYTSIVYLSNHHLLMIRPSAIEIFNIETLDISHYESLSHQEPVESYLNVFDEKKGNIIFEHRNKLFQLNTQWLQKTEPSVQLNKVLSNLEETYHVRHFDQYNNHIQFHFNGIWMTDPESITYGYKLSGHDQDWRYTRDRMANYPKLPPGRYRFLLNVSHDHTQNTIASIEYPFQIHRRFYNCWWFQVMLAGLLGILVRWYWMRMKAQELRQKEIEKKHIEAQLIHLKKQLNPHFLFNAFNTLIGLIEETPEKGLIFAEKLTDFYRLILDHGKNSLVPIQSEIELITLYVDVLNERFQHSISLLIDEQEINEFGQIPPLTLQLLVENAIKHNQFDQNQKLIIRIERNSDFIIVKNNLLPKTFGANSSGQGLQNIRRRYEILGYGQIHVHQSQNQFTVSLPSIQSAAI